MRIEWVGDGCLRVAFGTDATDEAAARVRAAYEALRAAPPPALTDLTPAYATLLLTFDTAVLRAEQAEAATHAALATAERAPAAPPRTVEVPVCYEGDHAPDLAEVARLHGMTPAEAAALHASGAYTVRFLGFSPGFPYLAGLSPALATPRLDAPRVRVPAGSVGIAGGQTGIYPQATPGGWRLVGRTPLRLFDARREPPALLALGDRVRFVPISAAAFGALAAKGA